mmetsp:Transcript_69928/g.191909  ORF Transcript_69928/g.191909 Transcript_69928/m.191909 type:complete len:209 (+) Transcript_69928:1261-1887(+)
MRLRHGRTLDISPLFAEAIHFALPVHPFDISSEFHLHCQRRRRQQAGEAADKGFTLPIAQADGAAHHLARHLLSARPDRCWTVGRRHDKQALHGPHTAGPLPRARLEYFAQSEECVRREHAIKLVKHNRGVCTNMCSKLVVWLGLKAHDVTCDSLQLHDSGVRVERFVAVLIHSNRVAIGSDHGSAGMAAKPGLVRLQKEGPTGFVHD